MSPSDVEIILLDNFTNTVLWGQIVGPNERVVNAE